MFIWRYVGPPEAPLSGILDFLNDSIKDSSPDNLATSWLKLARCLHGITPQEGEPGPSCESQRILPFIPGDKVPEEWMTTAEAKQTLVKIQEEFKGLLSTALLPNTGSALPMLSETRRPESFNIYVSASLDANGYIHTKISSPVGNYLDIYKYQFLSMLNGLHYRRVHQCPECQKFFLGKKNKMYCSKQCASRVSQRRFRSKYNEEYREYQRELMRDKYREKNGLKPLKKWKGSIKKIGGQNGCQGS